MNPGDLRLRRLANLGLAPPTFTSPAEAVRWMGAVQAQEYPISLWALGCRLPGTTERDVEQAVNRGQILRTWPMRGTVHFVPAEDARWMLELMAPRAVRRYQSYHQRVGLDEGIFTRSREVFIRALEGGKQLTRAALYKILQAEGISTADGRGGFIIGQLAHEGLVCYGPRQGKQPTVALLDEWAPNPRRLSREEALAEIALRYFRSHGPATPRDFTWWTGLLAVEARAGLEAVRSQLVEEDISGQAYWWADSTPAARPDSATLFLLPPFDEYLVSYTDRSAALDRDTAWTLAPEIHLGYTLVIDGQVAGTWKRTFQKEALAIEVTPARPLTGEEDDRLEITARRFGEFVGLPVVLIQKVAN